MSDLVKLIISYNMRAGLEESCQRFVVNHLGTFLNEQGFRFTDAWYTAWGDAPQMMGGGLLQDVETAREMLASDEWQKIMEEFSRYAEDISIRLVEASGSFQI